MSNFVKESPSSSKGGHFKQFFANSVSGQRNTLCLAQQGSSSLLPLQQPKKTVIDLESFSKHIVSSPSRKNLSNETTTLNASISNQVQNTLNQSVLSKNMTTQLNSIQNDSKLTQNKSTLQNSQKDNLMSLESSLVGTNNSKLNQSNINSRTLQLQRQFFFNGPERFENDKNNNYYGRSTINPLVDTNKYETSDVEQITYSKIFEQPKKRYDESKLYLSTVGLQQPKDRIKELNDVKEHQKLLQEWKQDHSLKTRQYKLAKAAYKSGISHIDGPLQVDTQIYQNEHDRFMKREYDEQNRRIVRLSYIEKFVTTNPAIFFDNSRSNTQFETKKHLFPHVIDDFQNNFTRKQKNELASGRNSQSFDRIFGHNLQDQKQIINSQRSKFLMSKDLYGKSQNIISNTLNPSLKYAV